MEENRATKWRRDLVTSFRGLPKQMLHFPMESQPHSVVDPFVACRHAALLGFARLLRCTSRNFDSVRQSNVLFSILATALSDFAQDDSKDVCQVLNVTKYYLVFGEGALLLHTCNRSCTRAPPCQLSTEHRIP